MQLLEVCVDNLQGVVAAARGDADRLELCASLADGGLTHSSAFIIAAKKAVNIPIYVMIRPRGGDFTCSDEEFAMMLQEVADAKAAGADGIVTGVINSQGELCPVKNAVLIAATNATEYHFSAKITQQSPLVHLYQAHPAANAQNIVH